MPFGFIISIYQRLHIPRCQATETNNFYLLMRKKKFTANFGLNTSSWMRKKEKKRRGEKISREEGKTQHWKSGKDACWTMHALLKTQCRK